MTDRRSAVSLRLILALAVAALVALAGWQASLPPRPLPADAPATAFSAARAMADVRAIGIRPHPLGSADSSRVADYLTRRLQAMGLIAEQRSYLVDDATALKIARWSRALVIPSELTDVVGVLPGADRTRPALLLMAHYDTVWGSAGAADDSAGVAAILEIVRAIRARRAPARDVIVLFTDGEETGLSGARAFFAGGGLAARIGVVLNLEARGSGGRAVMFETGRDSGALVALYGRVVPRPLANSLATLAYRKMPNNTDFSVPRDLGLAGMNFAFLGRAGLYHSPLSTIDRLDPGTVQDIGQQALGVAAALAAATTLPARTADQTFFDVGGRHFVRYAPGAGWLIVLAAAALVAIAWRRARPPRRAVAGGAASMVWVIANAALALALLNRLSGAGEGANYYDRLAALPRLEVQAWAAMLAVAIAGFALRVPTRRWLGVVPAIGLAIVARLLGAPGALVWPAALAGAAAGLLAPSTDEAEGGDVGVAIAMVLLAAIAQIVAAPAAWLLAWPALVVAAVLAVARVVPPLALPAAVLAALVAAPPLVACAHLLMLGLGAPSPEVLLLVLPSLFALFRPLARGPWTRATGIAVICLAVAAGVVAIRVRTDPIAASVPAYSLAW